MNWSEIKIKAGERIVVTDALVVSFFLWQSHSLMIPAIEKALEMYLMLVGSSTQKFYVSDDGELESLLPAKLDKIKQEKFHPSESKQTCGLTLLDSSTALPGHFFQYYGQEISSTSKDTTRNTIVFRFPTSFVDKVDLSSVCDFAKALTEFLPFSFGYLSPALSYKDDFIYEASIEAEKHPGFDLLNHVVASIDLDDKAAGIYWLSFLGKNLVTSLEGLNTLQSKLPSPVKIEPMSYGGVSITIDSSPSVGDIERGDNLPLYRVLAKVLEPQLYIPKAVYFRNSHYSPDREGMERWHKRFLL